MNDTFNFDEWFEYQWNLYKSAKDLFHGQQGNKTGAWKAKLKRDLSRPDLYEKFAGEGTLELNCKEASERFLADIKVKRAKKRAGESKTSWHLPMFSVYYGQGDHGRRYTWDIESISTVKESNRDAVERYENLISQINQKALDDALFYCEMKGVIQRGVTKRSEMRQKCMQFMAETGYAPNWVYKRLAHG